MCHYGDVTWASRRLKSPVIRLLVQQFKENFKVALLGLCEGNPSVTGGFPSQRVRKSFHLIASPWRHSFTKQTPLEPFLKFIKFYKCIYRTSAKHCRTYSGCIIVTSHECYGDLNHRQRDCLFSSLVRLTTKGYAFLIKRKTPKWKNCKMPVIWKACLVVVSSCKKFNKLWLHLRFHLCGRSFSVALPSLPVDRRQHRSGPDVLRRQRNQTQCLHRGLHQHL